MKDFGVINLLSVVPKDKYEVRHNDKRTGTCKAPFLSLKNINTSHTQTNGAVSKGDKQFISHPTWAQHTLSAAETVQVSHTLPTVCFSCLLRGNSTSFQDGIAAGEGFLCAPFQDVQVYDYSAV
jgi:hypothetical protein